MLSSHWKNEKFSVELKILGLWRWQETRKTVEKVRLAKKADE